MADNKKGGIRLRHLEQQGEDKKRDVSPNTANRKKIFERLCRASYNRQSYGFQLLKQFILFSSDEETIEIHYKYTQF